MLSIKSTKWMPHLDIYLDVWLFMFGLQTMLYSWDSDKFIIFRIDFALFGRRKVFKFNLYKHSGDKY